MELAPTSTVGRNRGYSQTDIDYLNNDTWSNKFVKLSCADSLTLYHLWPKPTVIISDGAYGILGFEGDTCNHLDLKEWYEPHIEAWSKYSMPQTTLWFWNSEIGWATVHPILEKYGWHYVNCNIWNKGKAHIAGNINTKKIRRFPVVTELCVQYVYEARINNMSLKDWLRHEWKRTGLPFKLANEACGVKDAATRKYLEISHLWYFPPPDMFEKLVIYANKYGHESGKPYYSKNTQVPMSREDWSKMRAKFNCPHGYTNIWNRNSLRGNERIKTPKGKIKSAHLNQKPLDLMRLIIETSSEKGDVVWEPFGGLFSGALAASSLGRQAFSAEIDIAYYSLGKKRFLETLLF